MSQKEQQFMWGGQLFSKSLILSHPKLSLSHSDTQLRSPALPLSLSDTHLPPGSFALCCEKQSLLKVWRFPKVGERESGRGEQCESGRVREGKSGRAREWESGRAGERKSGRADERGK